MLGKDVQIGVSGSLPCEIDDALAKFLSPHVGSALTDASISHLRSVVRAGGTPDYEAESLAFNYLYYSSNFVKSALAARSVANLLPGRALRFLDVGCGAGASTAGFFSGLAGSGHDVTKIDALDCSHVQLDIFRAVTLPWLRSGGEHPLVNLIGADMTEYLGATLETYDVIFLSYAVRELAEEARVNLRKILSNKASGDDTLIVIMDSDIRGDGLMLDCLGNGLFTVPYDSVSFRCLKVEALGFQARPKFTEKPSPYAIFDAYVKCWKDHDIALLKSLFHRGCRYEINGGRVLVGIEAVTDYWMHNSVRQKNVSVNYQIVNFSDNCFLVQWNASFDRVDTSDRRVLEGFMEIELLGDQVKRLSEVYVQKKLPNRLLKNCPS